VLLTYQRLAWGRYLAESAAYISTIGMSYMLGYHATIHVGIQQGGRNGSKDNGFVN